MFGNWPGRWQGHWQGASVETEPGVAFGTAHLSLFADGAIAASGWMTGGASMSFSATATASVSTPIAPGAPGLPDRIGGRGRPLADDEALRIERAWDEIDAQRAIDRRARVVEGQADAASAPPPAAGAPTHIAPPAAFEVSLPSGLVAIIDAATRAVVLPGNEAFSDDDMEAALLAVCLLAFDD